MSQDELIVAIVTVLFGGGVAGGIAAIFLLPKQRRQLDASTAQTMVSAATMLVDQLQEESQEARREVAQLRREITELRKEVAQLSAELADRDYTITTLRRVQQ